MAKKRRSGAASGGMGKLKVPSKGWWNSPVTKASKKTPKNDIKSQPSKTQSSGAKPKGMSKSGVTPTTPRESSHMGASSKGTMHKDLYRSKANPITKRIIRRNPELLKTKGYGIKSQSEYKAAVKQTKGRLRRKKKEEGIK